MSLTGQTQTLSSAPVSVGGSWGSHLSPNKDHARKSAIPAEYRSTGGQRCV